MIHVQRWISVGTFHFWSCLVPGARFSKVSKVFASGKPQENLEPSDYRAVLFTIWLNRGSIHTRSFNIFRQRFAGPKRFRGFRETGPLPLNAVRRSSVSRKNSHHYPPGLFSESCLYSSAGCYRKSPFQFSAPWKINGSLAYSVSLYSWWYVRLLSNDCAVRGHCKRK